MYFIRDYDGPNLYQGSSNPDVLILGQDPTIDLNTRFETVLGLGTPVTSHDRESTNLQNYIFSKILSPLAIDKSRILASNLVNLYYYDVPNRKIAKTYKDLILSTAEKEDINIEEYPDKANGAILHALNFKARTQRDFEKLLKLTSIHHLITLGEPVFQVLRERYNLDLDMKIRDVLKKIKTQNSPLIVQIGKKEVSLLPLPHIFRENNRNWQFYTDFINNYIRNLYQCYL